MNRRVQITDCRYTNSEIVKIVISQTIVSVAELRQNIIEKQSNVLTHTHTYGKGLERSKKMKKGERMVWFSLISLLGRIRTQLHYFLSS